MQFLKANIIIFNNMLSVKICIQVEPHCSFKLLASIIIGFIDFSLIQFSLISRTKSTLKIIMKPLLRKLIESLKKQILY